jgi:hypothetical protein
MRVAFNACCGCIGTSIEDTGLQPHEVSLISGVKTDATAFVLYIAMNSRRCG